MSAAVPASAAAPRAPRAAARPENPRPAGPNGAGRPPAGQDAPTPPGTAFARLAAPPARRLTLAALAGAVAATGFAPLGLWVPALLALALFVALAQTARSRAGAFFTGWFFGLGHFTLGLNWIAHAFTYQDAMPHWLGYGAVVALSLYLAVYPGLAVLALHLARRRWPALPVAPALAGLWVLADYGRGTLFTGFAWDPLGMIWLDTGVDQAARYIGTYGLSALAVLAGAALLAALRRGSGGRLALAAFLALGLAGRLALPAAPASAPASAPATGVAVTVVQPNIGQGQKYDPALDEAHFVRLATLTGPSSAAHPRLVFWPEAALPAWLDMEPEWRNRLAALLGPNDLLMTGGVKAYVKPDPADPLGPPLVTGARNSAWVLTPDSRLIGRYDKAHLVPYGEYLPMRALLQPLGLSRLVPGDTDFLPGPGPRSLPLPAAPGRPAVAMGVQICYEMIFSGAVVDRAHRPAFLYNPSNDAWFGDWGPPQHLAQARLRAIEEAMPILRSTPTGISAVIDGHGRVVAHVPLHRAGALNAPLPPALPATPFARLGNAVPLGLALFLLALAVATARRNR